MSKAGNIPDANAMQCLLGWKKTVSKYVAKKKTKGLEDVVQKAQTIKDEIERQIHNARHKKGSK
jgi:hypothetical protein